MFAHGYARAPSTRLRFATWRTGQRAQLRCRPACTASVQHLHSVTGAGRSAAPEAWRTVAATTAVAMLLCNAHRSAFSLLVPQVAAHFELAASDVGMLQSAMLVGYLVGQLPAGRLSDSLGGERVMIGSLLLWSISLVASGAVTSLPSLLLTRAAMGLFSACAMPGVSAMAAAWVPQASRSGVVAAIYAVFNLGGVVGMLVVPWLASAAGWRGALAWAGAAGVTWACVATVTLWRLVSGHPHRPCNDKITVNSASPLTAPTMLVSTAAATAASMSKAGSVAKAGTAWNSAPDLTAVAPASSSLEEPMFGVSVAAAAAGATGGRAAAGAAAGGGGGGGGAAAVGKAATADPVLAIPSLSPTLPLSVALTCGSRSTSEAGAARGAAASRLLLQHPPPSQPSTSVQELPGENNGHASNGDGAGSRCASGGAASSRHASSNPLSNGCTSNSQAGHATPGSHVSNLTQAAASSVGGRGSRLQPTSCGVVPGAQHEPTALHDSATASSTSTANTCECSTYPAGSRRQAAAGSSRQVAAGSSSPEESSYERSPCPSPSTASSEHSPCPESSSYVLSPCSAGRWQQAAAGSSSPESSSFESRSSLSSSSWTTHQGQRPVSSGAPQVSKPVADGGLHCSSRSSSSSSSSPRGVGPRAGAGVSQWQQVAALCWVHAAVGWGFFVLQSWLPVYLESLGSSSLSGTGQLAAAPQLAAALAGAGAGRWADWLIARGSPRLGVRQAMHVVSTLGCALSMLPLALRGGSGSLGPAEATAWLVLYNACYGFSFGGFHPYIQDVAGGSAGLLTGLTNSCSIAMGIVGNLCTGALVQMTGTFSTIFAVTMALYLSSCCVFLAVLKLQPIQL